MARLCILFVGCRIKEKACPLEFLGENALEQPVPHLLCETRGRVALCRLLLLRIWWWTTTNPFLLRFESTALWHFKTCSHMVRLPKSFHFVFLFSFSVLAKAQCLDFCFFKYSTIQSCLSLGVCPTASPHFKSFLMLKVILCSCCLLCTPIPASGVSCFLFTR